MLTEPKKPGPLPFYTPDLYIKGGCYLGDRRMTATGCTVHACMGRAAPVGGLWAVYSVHCTQAGTKGFLFCWWSFSD